MRLGIIDIGSNTVRLAVYDGLAVISGKVNYAGLISYISDGNISEKGLDILCSSVAEMVEYCKDCDTYYAFATASLRDINNKNELLNTVYQRTGVKIDIISGEKEAEYDYLGLKLHYNTNTGAAFDLGGGSAQLITFENDRVTSHTSKKIGVLKLYNTFVDGIFPSSAEEASIREYIRHELTAFTSKKHEFAYAMGGSASALAKLYQKIFTKDKDEFTLSELKSFFKLPENIIQSAVPERLYTIRPALITIEEICTVLKTDKIKCVSCGVRDGIIKSFIATKG